jgi:hypothetical protein
VTYSVAANTGTSTNTAAMTVASQIFTVTESGTGHQRRSYTSSRR